MSTSIISSYNTVLQHPGTQQTERKICSHVVWPGQSNDVEEDIRNCHKCQIDVRNLDTYHSKILPKKP